VTHRRWTRWLFAALVSSAVAAGCGGSSSQTSPSGSPVVGLTITGDNKLTAIGQHATLAAVANKADFTTMVVTSLTTWQSSNTAVVAVAGSSVTAVGAGSAVVTGSYQGFVGTLAIAVAPQADCTSYDALNWQIAEEADGFLLTGTFAGFVEQSRVFVFDTRADANNGLAEYQRFSTACYVGRSNSRANRAAYVFPYWTDATGRATIIQPEDCEPYVPSTLAVASAGATGWTLSAGSQQLLLLDSADDANTMLAVAQKYSSRCFIGRGNTRANPSSYILQYWK
jgi:hypothetical protein